MKILVFTLVLLLTLTYGETLQCNRCVPNKPGQSCSTSAEGCKGHKDACAAVTFLSPPFSHFKRCMKMSDCLMLQQNAYIESKCCTQDFCN